MEEKEMIEEIAEIINWSCDKKLIDYCNKFDDCNECIAIDIYKQGYRKIPEGSVVLTREEHQKYCAYKIIEPQIRGCLDRERELEQKLKELEEQRDRQAYITEHLKDCVESNKVVEERTRKETAEKIINWFRKHSVCIPSVEEINEFAKQYCVKV